MTGIVIHRKDSYIAVKQCESLVILKLKEKNDIQIGEMLKGNMNDQGDTILRRVDHDESIEVVILHPSCSIDQIYEYIN